MEYAYYIYTCVNVLRFMIYSYRQMSFFVQTQNIDNVEAAMYSSGLCKCTARLSFHLFYNKNFTVIFLRDLLLDSSYVRRLSITVLMLGEAKQAVTKLRFILINNNFKIISI